MSQLTQEDVEQALKHPLRRKLLPAFIENRFLSPTEAADLIQEPLPEVSYHVRVLVKYKFLVLRATGRGRGMVKSYYLPNDELLNCSIVKEFLDQNPSLGPE